MIPFLPKGAELVIIVIVIAVIFGPGIFIKAKKAIQKTGKAAKKGLENGADAAGVDLEAATHNEDGSKKSVMQQIDALQDKLDEKLSEVDEDEEDTKA